MNYFFFSIQSYHKSLYLITTIQVGLLVYCFVCLPHSLFVDKMSLQSFIHYRMKSAKANDMWSVFAFEGSSCSVKELETEILYQMKRCQRYADGTGSFEKTLKFKLNFTNLSGEPFVDSIPKNSSVLVSRSPIAVGTPIFLPLEPPPPLPKPVSKKTRFQNKVYQNLSLSDSKSMASNATTSAIDSTSTISSSTASSTSDSTTTPISNSTATTPNPNTTWLTGATNRLPFAKPPEGYVCRRCHVPGHLIQYCPTNSDVFLPPGYVCHRCQKPGHLIRNCPTNPPKFSSSFHKRSNRFHPYASIGSSGSSSLSSSSTSLSSEYSFAAVDSNTVISTALIRVPPPTDVASEETPLDSSLMCSECNHRLVDPCVMPCCFLTLCKECAIQMVINNSKCSRCSTEHDSHSLVLSPNTRISKLLLS